MTPQTATTFLDLADTRWAEIGAARPDLTAAIALQRLLVTRTIRTVDRLRTERPAVALDPAQVSEKLWAGTPVLRGESVALPSSLLSPQLAQACDDLAEGGAGDVARHVRACLDAGRIDVSSLLTASFNRNQTAIRGKAMHEGIAPDLLWLVAELAVGPAAHAAARALLTVDGTKRHPAVEAALKQWPHGYCPACASWPAFGEELIGGSRPGQLRCSFCGLGWQPRPACCIYCGGTPAALTSVKTQPEATSRAELCSECGGYLKWLEVPTPTPFELLAIEDLASADVDELAAQQGFGRPALPDLGGPDGFPCELVESD